jgi:hypothetical protein
MADDLERRIRRRARHHCEYCQIPQSVSRARYPIDHVIARQHGGATVADNLALACLRCNLHKGPNIAGIDPGGSGLTPLYHPRRDRWSDHFRWQGASLVGRTAIGRTTIRVLAINDPEAIAVREALIADDAFPPRR